MDSCPRGDLHTLPTATQLTQPVTTCVQPLVSYAEPVEQMTWLTRKSHRSSAPSNEQGRNGARPNHSPGAVVPHAGAAEVGPREGGAETAGPPGPPDPRDTAKDSGSQDTGLQDSQAGSQDTGPQDTGPQDTGLKDAGSQETGEWQSAMRAAAENTAFRAASSRSVWPGTEDRQAEPAPAAPQPSPGGPGVSSFGPLGAGLPPDTGQAGRSARPDEQIWEPRRLYHQPLLKPRRRGDPASPNRHIQPQPSQQAPQQQGPQQGTAPRNVRSGKTAVPKRRARNQRARNQRARNQRARNQRARNQRAQRSRARHNGTATFRSGGSRSPRAATRRTVPAHTHLARAARRVPAARTQARTQARAQARAHPAPSALRTGCTSAT